MCEAQMCCGQIADKRKLLDEFKQLEDNLKDAEDDLNAAYLKIGRLEKEIERLINL